MIIRMVMVVLVMLTLRGLAAENEVPPPVNKTEDTNALETLRTYLQLQEQIHAAQLAIEENRKEANVAAMRHAEALSARLQAIEQAVVTQRGRELEAMQGSHRVLITVATVIAGLGFLAMVLMVYSHWRTMNRFAEIASQLPASRALVPIGPAGMLPQGDPGVITVGPAEESSSRLLGAIDRLERRIHELEHSPRSSDSPSSGPQLAAPNGAGPEAAVKDSREIDVLLGKGQSLLNLDNAEEALACFDAIIERDPNHAEAWVKKGTALERLRKTNEALECYDRAIKLDGSMTIAYLYKGGLYNQMERFTEAIECYEKALRTQDTGGNETARRQS